MLSILPKLAPWPFARASTGVRKATRQAPLFGYAMTSADNGEFKITETYKWVEGTTNYSGWTAFDSSAGSAWYPADKYANNYIQIECATARAIASFSAYQDTSNGNHSGYLATTIRIMGSNDGTNYTQVANSAMTYAYDSVETKVYVSNTVKIAAPKAYKFYRIYIAPTNHPYVLLAGLVLQEAAPPTPLLAAQYRFIDKEAINEINESFATLTGTFSIADGKLTTGSTTASYAAMPRILFGDNEDFCIRVRQTFVASAPIENPIVAVWGDTTSVAWALWRNSNAGNKKIGFAMNAASANGARLYSIGDVADNVEVEIEVSRVNGTIYLFIDGVLQSSTVYATGNTEVATLPDMRTDVYGNAGSAPRDGFYNGGKKGALQIYKNKGGHTANYTKTDALETVTIPTYSSADQDPIVVNMALRRDNAVNEVNDTYLPITGGKNLVRRGRIVQDGSVGSYTSMRSDRFGDGDFTIECKVNFTSVNASTGAVLLGEWHRSDQVSVNNRWCIYVNPQRLLSFYVGKIDATGALLVHNGPTLSYGIDYHIVVERVGTTLTMYVNGVAYSTTFSAPIPGILPYNVATNSTASYYNWTGEIWNVRIAKKALYNGDIAAPYVLPRAKRTRRTYTAAEAQDIVLQYDFRSPREEKLGLLPKIVGSGDAAPRFLNNTFTTTVNNSFRFEIASEDFINGDFTIETVLSIDALSVANNTRYPLLGVWTQGAAGNSWSFAINASKQLGFFLSPDGSFDNAVGAWLGSAITFGREMHVVVECISRVVKIYIDSVAIGTITLPTTAVVPAFATNANPISSEFAADSGRRAAVTFKRIRIARKALFNGNVVKAEMPTFARATKQCTLVCGNKASDYPGRGSNALWDCYGVAQALYYPDTTVPMSIGMTSDTLFRTLDGKTKRLAGLFGIITNNRVKLAIKDASVTATPDMPIYTRLLRVNDKWFDVLGANKGDVETLGATMSEFPATPFLASIFAGATAAFEFLPPAATVTVGTANGYNTTVVFKGYARGLIDVQDIGSISNDLLIDPTNPRACVLYRIRGIWTQSNSYLCLAIETLTTDSYANLEKQYPNIADIPRMGTTIFPGDSTSRPFGVANQTTQNTGVPPYKQYSWSANPDNINVSPILNYFLG